MPPTDPPATTDPVPTRLALVRHGQSTWNALGRWQGQADPPLSPLGEEQAAEAAARLNDGASGGVAPGVGIGVGVGVGNGVGAGNGVGVGAGIDITAVVTSDLVRARRTGEIVADALALGPVIVCPALGEYDVGDWSGLTKPEIEERWPGQQADWFGGRLATTPGGEGRTHFATRVMDAVLRLGTEAAPGSVLLVVTHGGVIRALERATGSPPVPIANLCGRWFEVVPPSGTSAAHLRAGDPLTLVGTDHRTASPSA